MPELPQLRALIQISDDSGNDLIYGAVDCETLVGSKSPMPLLGAASNRRSVRSLNRRHGRKHCLIDALPNA
jgi:hypothetical protein